MTKYKVFVSTFLASVMMLAACGDKSSEPANPDDKPNQPQQPVVQAKDVKTLTTTSSLSYDLAEDYLEYSTGSNMAPSTIKLLPSETYQTIDGFGAAITGSTAYNLMKMNAADRENFLVQTFSPSKGYGYSYVRIPIGCSDFSLKEYTCCDTPGIENFALTSEETDYIIPVMKEILAINPDVKVMSAPWTAPKWMKVDNLTNLKPYDSWTSGQLNPKYYDDYATYFVKWIQAFENNGIKIYGVTPQNEPLNRGNSASMYMGWEEQRDFIKNSLGPKMQEAGLSTKIYAFDHNYNYDDIASQKSYPAKIYEDAEASKYIAGAAYHNYGGSYNELENIHKAYPDKELVFTESTAGDWNDGANLKARLIDDMEQITLGTVNRWAKGSIVWNLMLDSNRGPNRPGGCINGFGAVDLGADNKTIRKNSYYYIMAHMASAVKPDAQRIGTTGFTANGLTYSAFKNVDGSYALVLSNRSASPVSFTVDDGTHHFPATVPANGILSLSWK